MMYNGKVEVTVMVLMIELTIMAETTTIPASVTMQSSILMILM